MRKGPFVLLSAGVAGLVVLAGCGSSKPSAASVTTPAGVSNSSASSPSLAPSDSSTSTPSDSSTSTTSSAAVTGVLKGIVLQQTDLPAGWVGEPYTPDPSNSADQAALMACVGAKDTTADQTGDVNSDDFSLAEATISSSASKFRSQADITDDIAVLKGPKISPCYEVLLRKQLATTLPTGSKIDTVSVTVTPGSAGGPRNLAATAAATIAVTANGKAAVVYATIAFITGPLIEAEIDFIGLAAPVSKTLQSKLIAVVAGRAAKG